MTTEDPYLVKILKKHYKETGQEEKPLYKEVKGTYFFAKAIDKFGEYHYLSADSEKAIEDYCEGGILSSSLAIDKWATYVDPILVATHFKWVGKSRNPFVVSKPFQYRGKT